MVGFRSLALCATLALFFLFQIALGAPFEESLDAKKPKKDRGRKKGKNTASDQQSEQENEPAQAFDASLLPAFERYAQFSAAAYCPENNAAKEATKIKCKTNNCPLVEKDNVLSVGEYTAQGKTDGTGYVAADHTRKEILVVFRGSASVKNFVADANYPQVDADICDGCKAEGGFWNFWTDVREIVRADVKKAAQENPDYKFVVTGHSLGAAVAVFAAAEMRNKGYSPVALYTYGQPRAGNKALSEYITKQSGGNYRVTHSSDAVPKLPPLGGRLITEKTGSYVHISPEYWIPKGLGNDGNITVLPGLVNTLGNTGTGQKKFNVLAHLQYFQPNLIECGPII
jgi:hypothetical protein